MAEDEVIKPEDIGGLMLAKDGLNNQEALTFSKEQVYIESVYLFESPHVCWLVGWLVCLTHWSNFYAPILEHLFILKTFIQVDKLGKYIN